MNVYKVRRGDAYHRLVDRLEDFAFSSLSTSLYCSYTVRVTAMLGDMVDFFVNHIRSGWLQPPPQKANILLLHTWCRGGRRPPLRIAITKT